MNKIKLLEDALTTTILAYYNEIFSTIKNETQSKKIVTDCLIEHLKQIDSQAFSLDMLKRSVGKLTHQYKISEQEDIKKKLYEEIHILMDASNIIKKRGV